jgi:hypothetical protein
MFPNFPQGSFAQFLDRLEPSIIDATALLTFVYVAIKIWESETMRCLVRRWWNR